MRLFIAIEIPEDVKNYIEMVQEKIDNDLAKIRFIIKEQIHLTLKFLGEVQPNEVENIKDKLKKIKFKSFSTYLGSIGVFPNENYIRVVWIGLKPENEVLELQKNIDEKLKKLFNKEKNFKAHITLARVKFVEDKKKFVDRLNKIKIEKKKIDINKFKLMKSNLSSKGTIYEDLEVFGQRV